MRFQGDLVPADRTYMKADEASDQVGSGTGMRVVDGSGEQQPVGPRHDPAEVAAAVTAAIQGLGMTVEIDGPISDKNDPNDGGPNNRELDSFTTIDAQGKELSVLVSPTECRVDVDSFDGSPQERHVEGVRFIRAVERATGMRLEPVDEKWFLEAAGYYGVDADGTVRRPATLSEDELEQRLRELGRGAGPEAELARPTHLIVWDGLRTLAENLSGLAAAESLPLTLTYDLYSDSTSSNNSYDPLFRLDLTQIAGGRSVQLGDFPSVDLISEMRSHLGDDESGRPLQVAFVVDVDRRVTTEVRFDHVVDQGRELWEWEGLVLDLLERSRGWTPQWALAAVPLLTAAGRDLSYKRISS